MGVLDVPAPLFDWVDSLAGAAMPAWLRLVLWGAIAAVGSMLLYRRISPQDAIRRGKRQLNEAQKRLLDFDGELSEAWPLIRDMLYKAFGQVGRVAWPAALASLPLLFILSWLSSTYGYTFPAAGAAVQIETTPRQYKAEWIETQGASRHIVVRDDRNQIVLDARMQAPVPILHKWRWWNMLVGNPAGYLPVDSPVEQIQAQMPRQQHLSFVPDWMGGWEILFFGALLVVSIGLKLMLKIA